MAFKAKLAACGLAAAMTSGCTVEEMQSFALGASVAALAISASQSETYSSAYGPTYCDPGYTLELGYDEYDNPVRFCAPADPFFSQAEFDALAAQAK